MTPLALKAHHAVTFSLWRPFQHDVRSLSRPNSAVLGVNGAVKMKVSSIAKPNVLRKGRIGFTILRKPSGKVDSLLLVTCRQLVMNRHLTWRQSEVLSKDSPNGAVAAVDFLGELSDGLRWIIAHSSLHLRDGFRCSCQRFPSASAPVQVAYRAFSQKLLTWRRIVFLSGVYFVPKFFETSASLW